MIATAQMIVLQRRLSKIQFLLSQTKISIKAVWASQLDLMVHITENQT